MPMENVPRWVKVFAVLTAVLIVLLVIMLLSGHAGGPGDHNPARHSSPRVVQGS